MAGTDVTGVPDRLWVLSLDRSGSVGGGLTAKYTSSRRVSLTSDWYAGAYWLVDAYVSFSGEALSDLLRSTEFSIVANNLLDEAYLSAITENAAWLGAPRTISMRRPSPSDDSRRRRPAPAPSRRRLPPCPGCARSIWSRLRKACSAEFLPEAAGRARVSGRDAAFAGWQ